MANLQVHDFSCLKHVDFEIAPVTVLIGPQGSGKSVTTKLAYFFYDQLTRQHQSAEKGVDLDDFKKEAARQFRTWFPPSAWGSSRFNINFTAGAFTARILRRSSRGSVSDDVAVTFSDHFNANYTRLCNSYAETRTSELVSDSVLRHSMERTWAIREKFDLQMANVLSRQYVTSQTFVPAGRAFFTSIGRLVAAFDQGSTLDPVTLRFAKLFAVLRDRGGRIFFRSQPNADDKERQATRRTVMSKLFGGEIKFENELEFVETRDGRRVPFSALSSGQQELLPMWLLIDYLRDVASDPKRGGDLVYIEEPEAHLFPSAQSVLLDYLIGSVVSTRANRSLLLTTHSPYILSKLNNYLKAGSLGKKKRFSADINRIVDQQCWLTPDNVRAYAIADGVLVNLIDDDGLIDGAYIDQVSEDVARQFSALLDIEYPANG
jgi:energy-coupling factor transporter ATP-binding protein EcfA2